MPDGQGWILFKMRKAREMLFLKRYFQLIARTPCVKNGALILHANRMDGFTVLDLTGHLPLRRNTAASLPMDMKAVCSRSA